MIRTNTFKKKCRLLSFLNKLTFLFVIYECNELPLLLVLVKKQ